MRITPWILLPSALLACGTPEPETTDDTEVTDTEVADTDVADTEDTEADAISHATDIQSIWTSRCTPCHITSTSGGLSLVDAYDKIVGVEATGGSPANLIVAGDASTSYIFQKITDAAGISGGSMPPGGSIPQAEIDLIEDWIDGGAAE